MDRIVATLKYGKIFRKGLIFLWIMLLFGLFFFTFSFTFLFGEDKSIIGFIGANLCFCIFSGSALYLLIKNDINVKSCKKWLNDAVELYAKSNGIKKTHFAFTDIGMIKLKVSFEYNGNKIEKYSGSKQNNGFDRVFSNYSDKQIKIMYSPKYDEVMILKGLNKL